MNQKRDEKEVLQDDGLKRPNCYSCAWRKEVLGSVHSECLHPDVRALYNRATLTEALIQVAAGKWPKLATQAAKKLGIKAIAWAIQKGYFLWPFDYDPAFLKACNGYTKIDRQDKAKRGQHEEVPEVQQDDGQKN